MFEIVAMNAIDITLDVWSNGPAPESKDIAAQTQRRKKRGSIVKLGKGLLD